MIFSVRKYMKKLRQRLALVVNFILLSVIYFIGVGITSLTAKIFGKSFLSNKNKKQSSFVAFKETRSLESMF